MINFPFGRNKLLTFIASVKSPPGLPLKSKMSEVAPCSFNSLMAAAVSDYRPKSEARKKLKKDVETITIELVRNPDIIKEVGAPLVKVGFAAENMAIRLAEDLSDRGEFVRIGSRPGRVVEVGHDKGPGGAGNLPFHFFQVDLESPVESAFEHGYFGAEMKWNAVERLVVWRLQENAVALFYYGGAGQEDCLGGAVADKEVVAALGEDGINEKFDMGYHTKHVDTIFKRVFGA